MGGKGRKRVEAQAHSLIKRARDGDDNDAPVAPPAPRPEPGAAVAATTPSALAVAAANASTRPTAAAHAESLDDPPELDVAFDDGIDRPAAGGGKRVIVILERASLEPVKSKTGQFELLNCDDHLALHKKLNKDPADSRPDITHQCLLSLLDSPLNKAGLLTVYIHTESGVLVEVSPSVRIPRTFKRFAGLMVQLLHKLRIRATEGSKTLLRVIKNPVTDHLPINCRKFCMEVGGALVDVNEFVDHLPNDDSPICFVFGATARGNIAPDYTEATLQISNYPLSGSVAVSRLLCAFERKWSIL